MYRIYLFKAGLLAYGIGLVILGIITLLQGRFVLEAATVFGGIVLVFHGFHLLFKVFIKNSKNKDKANSDAAFRRFPSYLAGVFNILGGVLIIILPNMTLNLLLILFSGYVFLNAAVKLIDYYIASKNNDSSMLRLSHLVSAVFYSTFGILITFVDDMGIMSLFIVAGVYLILYGMGQIKDFVAQIIPQKLKLGIKRDIRISVPVFVSIFMPYRYMNNINNVLKNAANGELAQKIRNARINNNEIKPEIEVLIHISNNGAGKLGHCDLAINGEVLSFGNYDMSKSKMFRFYGDGVMLAADRDKYIDFSINYDKKMVIGYRLNLNEEQIEKVKAEVKRIKNQAYSWEYPVPCGETVSKLHRYSEKWKYINARCFKFRSGRFKNYFLLSTNCVLLTDSILGKAGTDIIRINGIITPGKYFDYLQRQLMLPDGIVTSRQIYSDIYSCATNEKRRSSLLFMESTADLQAE